MSRPRTSHDWLLHARSCAERELLEPLIPFLAGSEYIETKAWRSGVGAALVGLHGKSQAERAEGAEKASHRVVVALVELFEQWTPEYLYGHDSQCLRTIGGARYVLAPTCIKQRLEDGILADHSSFARGVNAVCERMHQLRAEHLTGRYLPERVSPEDFATRVDTLSKLSSRRREQWGRDRIIDAGLPRVIGPFFDGVRLRAPGERRSQGAVVAFIEQGHGPEVRSAVAEAARVRGMEFVGLPPKVESETEAWRAARIERGRAALHAATVVVTEYSNLAYQAALDGKRVLYCTWRAGFRPLPLLVSDGRFAHVREATSPGDVARRFEELAPGGWAASPGPVPTTDPAVTVDRLIQAVEGASVR